MSLLHWRAPLRSLLIVQSGAVLLPLIAAVFYHRWTYALLSLLPTFLPGFLLDRAARNRVDKIAKQIDGWVMALANALRGCASLGDAIASSIDLVQEPLRTEITLIIKEYRLGTPLDTALDNFATRVQTDTVSSTVLSLRIARRSGGNLPNMLESAAAALRELARLEGVVRAKTAEGRAQAWVVSSIPLPLSFLLNALRPGFFQPLFRSLAGYLVLGGAFLLWLTAVLVARKILKVDI